MLSALLPTCEGSSNAWNCVEDRGVVYIRCDDAIIVTVTRMWAERSGVDSRHVQDVFLFTKNSSLLSGSPNLLVNGYRGIFLRG